MSKKKNHSNKKCKINNINYDNNNNNNNNDDNNNDNNSISNKYKIYKNNYAKTKNSEKTRAPDGNRTHDLHLH